MNRKLIIAVDGFSACGKSTLAKDLAKTLDYTFIDSGAMYRGVTLFALRNGSIENDLVLKDKLISQLSKISLEFRYNPMFDKNHLYLNDEDVENMIRNPEIAAYVSKVARIKEVREKLVQEQRLMGKNGGVVMDGRDIGSVVFPHADLKLFVTADIKTRANRRLKELEGRGINTTFESVLSNLLERDQIDVSREESPLIQTKEALLIDTTNYTRESQLEHVLKIVVDKFGVLADV